MEPPPAAPSSSSSSAVQSRVEATRIQLLNRCKLPPPQAPPADTAPSTPFVLYWMQNSVRSKHSPALEHAAAIAAHLNVPLRVAYTFDAVSQDGNALTERHAYFLLQTLADAQKTLREERNVTLAVVAPGNAPEVSVRALAADALAVVTDTSYLRRGITDRLRVAEALRADNKPFCAVEGDIVVPVEEVTDKAEHAARTIRPKITRHLGKYLVPLKPLSLDPKVQPKIAGGTRKWLSSAGLETLDVRSVDAAVASIAGLDCLAPRVPEVFFVGGETAAQETLTRFLKERLDKYATGRNEPAMSLQSDLSPFLRVGAISPVDVALQTKAYAATQKTKAVAEGVSAFLEEMIIRRELGANMCWFGRDDYDVYERTVPQYARESLGLHKADPRPVIYSYEVLEAGLTSDTYWNTAQLELLVTGKQHGYMRMYWAKQIIGWTPDAETALDYCVRLNNRWELDAVDPNSYAGIVWNFGRHDQGWKEREIWGKVRYMNESGLKRKFNMAAYISKVEMLVEKHGLPSHIQAMHDEKPGKRSGGQKTIGDMFGKATGSNTRSKAAAMPAPSIKRRKT